MTRQYYGIEDVGLTGGQRQTLVDALRQIGANQHPNPSRRNHWRVSLANDKVIFEALWNNDDWTVDTVKNRLGNVFNVDPATISDSVQQTQYGPVVTFSRPPATPRIRLVAFGGLLATWEQSHDAVLQYLANNILEWESEG